MTLVEYEELLRAAGAMGPWQLWLFGWIWLSQFFQAMNNMAIVFMQFQPEFHCIDNDNASLPISQCTVSTNGSSVQSDDQGEIPCIEWSYDDSILSNTIVTEWDLVCDHKVRVADAQMVFMIGFFIGALFSGFLSDKFGRRRVVATSGVLVAVFGVLQANAPTFTLFLLCRFGLSVANVACYSTAFVLCMEATTSEHRDWVGGLFYVPYALGYVTLSLVAYYVRDWRQMHTLISLPVAVDLLFYWILPESPRWLLSEGRSLEVERALRSAARANGRLTELKQKLRDVGSLCSSSSSDANEDGSSDGGASVNFWHLFRHRRLAVRCLLMCFIWLVTSLVYYGVSLNVTAFSGDLFVNNALFGAVELPAYALCVPLLWWGRRRAVASTLLCVAAALVAVPLVGDDVAWLRLPLAIVGKLAITATFAVIFVQTTELFPTVVRDTGLGIANSAARIGSMIAPYISLLSTSATATGGGGWSFLPMLIYGCASFVAAVVALFLPETKQSAMPESLDDALRSDDCSSCDDVEQQNKLVLATKGCDVAEQEKGLLQTTKSAQAEDEAAC